MNRRGGRAAYKIEPAALPLLAEARACLARRDSNGAAAAAAAAIAIDEKLAEAHYFLANARLLQGKKDEAIASYRRAVAFAPHFAEAHCHLGVVLESLGRVEDAEHALRAAIAARSIYPDAFFSLGNVLARQGHLSEAIVAYRQAIALKPNYPQALDNLDIALKALQAAHLDQRAVAAQPRLPDSHARDLLEHGRHSEARVELTRLLRQSPGNPAYRALDALAMVGLGRHEEALRQFTALLAATPIAGEQAELHLVIGHALKALGRSQEAIDAYRRAIAARPDFGDAYWSLADLKTYCITDQELEQIIKTEAAPSTSPADRCHMCFALGKAYEDRKEYEKSFRYYERGNALKRAENSYRRVEPIELNTVNQKRVCTRAFFEERRGAGSSSDEPIFILGMPRSGSTLIEQILASHSKVEGTQELTDIQRIVLDFQGRDPDADNPRYPTALAELRPDTFSALAQKYLGDTRSYRSGKPRFIDKMPNNFGHIGLIHLLFPNAKIIDARREPMACCFSNLKQLFGWGQKFTYSIEDVAQYYRSYLELMEHWDEVLPGRVLRVWHEDVVNDLDGNVRRILEHCGLPFEPACLAFHETKRPVYTPSAGQVRQPIFRDGLDQWKNFEPWLGPLRLALGDALSRYRK